MTRQGAQLQGRNHWTLLPVEATVQADLDQQPLTEAVGPADAVQASALHPASTLVCSRVCQPVPRGFNIRRGLGRELLLQLTPIGAQHEYED